MKLQWFLKIQVVGETKKNFQADMHILCTCINTWIERTSNATSGPSSVINSVIKVIFLKTEWIRVILVTKIWKFKHILNFHKTSCRFFNFARLLFSWYAATLTHWPCTIIGDGGHKLGYFDVAFDGQMRVRIITKLRRNTKWYEVGQYGNTCSFPRRRDKTVPSCGKP